MEWRPGGWLPLVLKYAVGAVGLGVVLFYVNRIFGELPLYAGDEGAYLIRALMAREIERHPEAYPLLQPVANTLFLGIVRLIEMLSLNVVQWTRLVGAASYALGLGAVYLIARDACGRKVALGFLAIAAAFPYYRFAVAAMPEGPYVGLLGLIALLIQRTFFVRPLWGAALTGALTAALVLTKAHGVVAVAAYGALSVAAVLLHASSLRLAAGRIAVFATFFLATGTIVQLSAGETLARAPGFFLGASYAQHLGHAATPQSLPLAVLAAATMAAVVAMFALLPFAAGLLRVFRRKADGVKLDRSDVAFLFLALCLAGTLAMVTVFAFKMAVIETETKRIWGRYFEFYVPLLWLAAAPAIVEMEAAAGRWMRLVLAGGALVGLAVLLVAFAMGVHLFPWDATALTAFSAPDIKPLVDGWSIGRLAAITATLLMVIATALGVRSRSLWPAYFVALGLLSTRMDDAWVGEISAQWTSVEHELHVAGAFAAETPGRTAVLVADLNQGHVAFLRLKGAGDVRLRPPGPIDTSQLGDFGELIVFGADTPGPGWRPVFVGKSLSLFAADRSEPRP